MLQNVDISQLKCQLFQELPETTSRERRPPETATNTIRRSGTKKRSAPQPPAKYVLFSVLEFTFYIKFSLAILDLAPSTIIMKIVTMVQFILNCTNNRVLSD